jgi:O-antigen/teichoic acid export membrane protein
MQTFQTFASMFGVLFINVFSAVILSRGLTPDDRGLYLGVTMWSGFILGICDVGIYISTVYLWGKSTEQERKDLFTTLLIWAIGTGVICGFIALLLADFMIKDHLNGSEKLMANFFYFSSVCGPLTNMVSAICATEQRFTVINLIRIGVPTVLTLCWLVYFVSGTLTVAMCLLTTALIPFIALVPLLWQVRFRFKSLGKFRRAIFQKGLWYGLRGHGGSVMNVVGNSGSQILVFALTPAALAFFQTASSASGVIYAIPMAIGITSFPDMVKEDQALLHQKLCRFFRLTASSTFVGVILLGLLEPFLIPFLFGSLYMSAIVPAVILLPSALFGGLSNLVGGGLSSTGRTLHNTVADAVNVGTTLICMTLTLNTWGITGAAFSTLSGSFMSLTVRLLWYHFSVERISTRDLMPSYSDFQELFHIGSKILRKVNQGRKGKLSVNSR